MRLLDEVLCRLAAQKPQAEAVAVVITGELTDCIYPKKEGFESFLSHG